MKRALMEKHLDKMVLMQWRREGEQSAHGMTFKDACDIDAFGYRDKAEIITKATLALIAREKRGRK